MTQPIYLNYDFQNNKVINVSAGSATGEVVVYEQLQAALAGVKWKASVRAATTANGTLATAFENGDTLDGITLATGDRILLKNQSTASENGIYTVNASGAPSRASDADAFAELNGAVVMIEEGTVNANNAWTQTAQLTALSDNQTWVQFGAGTSYTGANAISVSGSVISLLLDGSSLTQSGSGLKLNVVGSPVGHQSWLGPASAGSTIVQAHGYGHANALVTVKRVSDNVDIRPGVQVTVDSTNITVTFGSSQADRSAFRIIAVG